MTALTKENYASCVLESDKPVLIDFWATWCGPCRMIAPIMEEIAAERTDLSVVTCNVDEQEALAVQFGVSSIPTLVLMDKGTVRAVIRGYMPKETLLRELGL